MASIKFFMKDDHLYECDCPSVEDALDVLKRIECAGNEDERFLLIERAAFPCLLNLEELLFARITLPAETTNKYLSKEAFDLLRGNDG